MNKFGIAAALAATCAATPVLAQSGPMTGPRVEATVGWDDVVINAGGESAAKSGVTYGGEIGYDVQFGGGALVGVYAGADGSSTRECVVDGTERSCIKAGRNFTAGVRVGGAVGATGLLYLKGGYSNGRLEGTYTDSAFPADNERGKEDMDGFHAGAGAQVGFGRGLYGKAEYNYTRYSTYDLGGIDARLDRHRIVGGIGYHF